MRQLYQGSLKRAQHARSSALLPCWWATFLIGGISGRIALFFATRSEQEAYIANSAPELLNAINMDIVAHKAIIFSSVCLIICALLLLRIIQQINRAHTALHDARTSDNAIAPPKAA